MGAASALLALGATPSARASGYEIPTQSAKLQGTSNAGAAEADGPWTLFTNPAGLTRLDGTQASVGFEWVSPHSTVTIQQATDGTGTPLTRASNGGNYARSGVSPQLYLSHRVSDRYTVGLGVFAPYGAKAIFSNDFAGRYYNLSTEIKSVNINPSLGIRLDEHHSIGVGVSAQYFSAKLSNAYSLAALTGGALSAPDDVLSDVGGSNWAYGYNLGYLYSPDDATRVGLAFRSRIVEHLKGTAQFDIPASWGPAIGALPALGAAFQSGSADATITTPESVSLSGYRRVAPQWAVMADVTWTRQSELRQIRIDTPTALLPTRGTTTLVDWKNAYSVAVGASHDLSDAWIVRAGYMYDQSPVPDAAHALTTLADADRQWLSLGATYRFSPQDAVDMAFSEIWLKRADIARTDDDYNPANGTPGTLVAQYRTKVALLSLQYTRKF